MRSMGKLKRINRRKSTSFERDDDTDDDEELFFVFGGRHGGIVGPKTVASIDFNDCGLFNEEYCGINKDDDDDVVGNVGTGGY